MRIEKTIRGFTWVRHPVYGRPDTQVVETRLIQESSAVDFDLPDSLENPGSSYLWVGEDHHLNRDEVKHLVGMMNYWLRNKRLPQRLRIGEEGGE